MIWTKKLVGKRSIVINPAKVVGKGRPRFGNGRTYTPKATERAEAAIRDAWLEAYGKEAAGFPGPVSIAITYQRQLAKSNPLYWAGRCDLSVPDLDNVAKLCCDALNGIAWRDDSQITDLSVSKMTRSRHGDGNRIEVFVCYYREERHEL